MTVDAPAPTPTRSLNQAPPLAPYNVFEADLPLREAVEREGGGWGVDRAARHRRAGRLAGGDRALRALRAQRAACCAPTTATATAIDEVELDPSWHWLLREAIEREIHSLPWRDAAARRPRGPRRADVTSGARSAPA